MTLFSAQIIVLLLPQILVDAAAGYGLTPSQSFYFLLWASRRLYCHNNNNTMIIIKQHNMLALSRQCNGFSNRLHLCPGLNAAAKLC